MGLFNHWGSLDYEPAGEYVTKKRVDKVSEFLTTNERVMYLTKGSTIAVTPPDTDITDSPEEFATDNIPFGIGLFRRPVHTIVTDHRVLLSAPHEFKDDARIVDYDEILGLDLASEATDQRLVIQTSNEAYWIHVSKPSRHEAREIPRFIHEQIADASSRN